MDDQRFKHVLTDPKFRRIPKKDQKIKIDKRFQSMFNDKKFKVKYTTDKRGRPVNRTSTEDLKRYYELSSDEESSESEGETREEKDGENADAPGGENVSSAKEEETNELEENVKKPAKEKKKNKSDLNKKHKSDKVLPEDIKKKLKNLNVDYARGESTLYSESSSDDEESDEEVSEGEQIDHKWGELDLDAERTEEATYRLAACNMDWDRIRAIDLMVLFNSFLPPKGLIKSVVIYPSEFGKQRIQEEEVKGPVELVESKLSDDEDEGIENENEEGSGYHMEKLRQYQLNRLKYYYAVITFDSANSANKIYKECDGMEYESSAIKLDLRFVPDEMEFDDEPKELCNKLPELNKYEPRFFTTTALQQAKVDLTWDETNPDRIEMTQKLNSGKVDDITEADLQNYLASSSDEENDDVETKNQSVEESDEEKGKNIIDKYKALLQDIEEKESAKKDEVQMEISWGIDLKEKTDKLSKARAENAEQTPFQQYLEKRKTKRKEKRKQKLEGRNKDNESDESGSDIPSDVDMNDPYFAEEFNNHEFEKKKKKNKKPDSKKRENNEEKNAELELLLMNEDDNKKHFSLNKIQETENKSKSKKKRKNKNKHVDDNLDDDFEINTKDERFSALFTSHHFNIDPTDSHYKKTKGMGRLIDEKLKRRCEETVEEIEGKKVKMDKSKAELNVLVKSVKRKANSFKNK